MVDRALCFREQVTALLESGAELIFFETFMDFGEMELALCVNEVSNAPAICSFACSPEGRLASGSRSWRRSRSWGYGRRENPRS